MGERERGREGERKGERERGRMRHLTFRQPWVKIPSTLGQPWVNLVNSAILCVHQVSAAVAEPLQFHQQFSFFKLNFIQHFLKCSKTIFSNILKLSQNSSNFVKCLTNPHFSRIYSRSLRTQNLICFASACMRSHVIHMHARDYDMYVCIYLCMYVGR